MNTVEIDSLSDLKYHRLIELIAVYAQEQQIPLYLVGGVLRDLLLHRQNNDLDFVVDGNAISFTAAIRKQFGGGFHSFGDFGTACWTFVPDQFKEVGLSNDLVPHHADFATTRTEIYARPGALPTVQVGSIENDLLRRDFTMNSLALQLSPHTSKWQLLDISNGYDDLNNGLIRAHHKQSFIDDPTRILRAIRFQQRLGFEIDPQTQVWMSEANPLLGQLTGERVYNEINLILQEREPLHFMLELQRRDMLTAIHPDFELDEDSMSAFFALNPEELGDWPLTDPLDGAQTLTLHWNFLAAALSIPSIEPICKRLLMSRFQTDTMMQVGQLMALSRLLNSDDLKPSTVYDHLLHMNDTALTTAWLLAPARSLMRQRLKSYVTDWRPLRLATTGLTLTRMNLKPGPVYATILRQLRKDRLDGIINSDAEERASLQELVSRLDEVQRG